MSDLIEKVKKVKEVLKKFMNFFENEKNRVFLCIF